MAQAIPLVTRADPTATRRALTEGYLTQPMVMAEARWQWLSARGTSLRSEGCCRYRGGCGGDASSPGTRHAGFSLVWPFVQRVHNMRSHVAIPGGPTVVGPLWAKVRAASPVALPRLERRGVLWAGL